MLLKQAGTATCDRESVVGGEGGGECWEGGEQEATEAGG